MIHSCLQTSSTTADKQAFCYSQGFLIWLISLKHLLCLSATDFLICFLCAFCFLLVWRLSFLAAASNQTLDIIPWLCMLKYSSQKAPAVGAALVKMHDHDPGFYLGISRPKVIHIPDIPTSRTSCHFNCMLLVAGSIINLLLRPNWATLHSQNQQVENLRIKAPKVP